MRRDSTRERSLGSETRAVARGVLLGAGSLGAGSLGAGSLSAGFSGMGLLGMGLLGVGLLAACSPTSSDEGAPAAVAGAPSTGGDLDQAGDEPGISGLVNDDESPFVPVDESAACASERAERVESKDPVDIILIVDNSASMAEELAATELNINQNFAAILEDSGLDYRLIALTLHRPGRRNGSGPSATMLCVQEPLSGLDDCTVAPEPVFSDRFFQYSTRVGSSNSLDLLLDTYAPPFVLPDDDDQFGNAPNGWSEWLRPGVKKVFLEMTDGNEDMLPNDFMIAISELDPVVFGADPAQPGFVFHSIVDVAAKADLTSPYLPDEAIQETTCSATGIYNTLATAGDVYQEVSRRTKGLRFPLCQSAAYDVVFREIAGRVIAQSEVACDFPVPEAPAGRELDLDTVSVEISHDDTGAPLTRLGQARVDTDCQDDAFFILDGRIQLCPDVCSAVRGEQGARVDVLFGCESAIIVR